jgi:hypothetical protein
VVQEMSVATWHLMNKVEEHLMCAHTIGLQQSTVLRNTCFFCNEPAGSAGLHGRHEENAPAFKLVDITQPYCSNLWGNGFTPLDWKKKAFCTLWSEGTFTGKRPNIEQTIQKANPAQAWTKVDPSIITQCFTSKTHDTRACMEHPSHSCTSSQTSKMNMVVCLWPGLPKLD